MSVDIVMDADGRTMSAVEGNVPIINESGLPDHELFASLGREISGLSEWVNNSKGLGGSGRNQRGGGLFNRDKWVTPDKIVDQFITAYKAATEDDIVSSFLDQTESLAISRMSLDATESDEQTNIWGQISVDLDLGQRLREIWRDLHIFSQAYVAVLWGEKSYKVKGKTASGNKARRGFNNLKVPIGITLLDPTKIVPIGSFLFGKERLAYIADEDEVSGIRGVLTPSETDPIDDEIVKQLFVREIKEDELTGADQERLNQFGAKKRSTMFELNPEQVRRITFTRSPHESFAAIRVKSVFELLDLKHQLRAMDRVHLLAGTNFILLITKGSDDKPATSAEIQSLSSQVRTVAKSPILVGDHRLNVEIVTPKTDNTLDATRYNGIDSRITARLYQILVTGGFQVGGKGDDSLKLARFIAVGLQSRREMIRTLIRDLVIEPTLEKNPSLSSPTELQFHPRRISIDFDSNFAAFLQDLRDRGDISRETILEQVDFDQTTEFERRKFEAEEMDDTFQTTTPWGPLDKDQDGTGGGTPPDRVAQRRAGRRQGGNRNGGGTNTAPVPDEASEIDDDGNPIPES